MATVAEALRAALQHQQAGRLEAAERLYRQVLQVEPRQADALHLLGLLAHQVGRHDEAMRSIAAAIAVAPTQPLFHASLAGVFRSRGLMADAEASYREALRLQPNHPDWHNDLGNVLRSQGRLHEAEASYREALRLRPADAIALANLGAVLIDLGQCDEAEGHLRSAIQLQPGLAPAHAYLANVLHLNGRLSEAEGYCRAALDLAPQLAEGHKILGTVYYKQGRLDRAEASYREAIRLSPTYAEAYTALGDLLRDRQKISAARAAFAEAVRLQPQAVSARNNLAACLIEEGQPAEAITHLQEVLRRHPGYVPALGNLGTLARDGLYHFRDEDTAQLRDRLADPTLPAEQRCTLCFALAHVLDRQKNHDEAFAYYRQANDTKWQIFQERGQGFDRAEHRRFIDQTIAIGTAEFFARVRTFGLDTELPVFIVGMPRSGTTLVEQILASHPQVFGGGERQDMPNLGRRLAQLMPHAGGYPACLNQLDAATARTAAEQQQQRLIQRGGSALRVTDKLPANIFHLPLIHLLFPRAHIIHCLRDPLDVCVSCYLQDFYALSFANRLDDIGVYYREYASLADHWRATFPAPILEVRYEDLIARQEAISRELIAFCGLDWDDRCLAFHENKRVVQTSSVAQVRQPIYHNAVGRWKRYEKHLQPLFEALGRSP